jgi:N-acyl-D-aspartate/D-glutamate deacylase
MERVDPLVRRGAKPQMHSTNLVSDLSLRDPYMMTALQSWHGLFNQSAETQKGIYRDPAFRGRFREEMKTSRAFHGDFSLVWVSDTGRADLQSLVGKSIAKIAEARGDDPFDLFFDLALEDNLDITYTTVRFGVPEEYLGDERTLIGLSDGGAHIGILCNAGYTTEMLGDLVRDRKLLTMELAIKRITSEPADFFGLADRGRIAEGMAADLAIFDPLTVGSNSARPKALNDLPGGGRRLIVEPQGMAYTAVNGEVLYDHGQATDARPGKILRGGASA